MHLLRFLKAESWLLTKPEETQSGPDKPLLFPNPPSGSIHINESVVPDIIFPIRVLDATGQQVKQWNTAADITATNMPAGCYYIVFTTTTKAVTEKLIVLTE